MKRRLTAATVAAATALSLTVAPAANADNGVTGGYQKDSSSQVTDGEVLGYMLGASLIEFISPGSGYSQPHFGSSKAGLFDIPSEGGQADLNRIMLSSYRNDANAGLKVGTTYDIIVGTGIALAILASLGGFALSQGLVKF